MADYGGSLRGGVGPGILPGTGGDDNLLDFSRILQEYGINGAGADAASAMPYGPGRYPDPVQPNTLEPYTGLPPLGESPTTTPEREAYLQRYGMAGPGMGGPPLPMAGNGGMALPVAQAPELPGMLPTMDIAPAAPNPWQTFARMAQGALAGMTGQQNPVIRQELAQQELDLRRQQLQQTQLMESLKLDETRRARATAEAAEARRERTDEDKRKFEEKKFVDTQINEGIKSPDLATRIAAVRDGQKSGRFPIDGDPGSIAARIDPDYAKKHDQAIDLIAAGRDPLDIAQFGRQFDPTVFPIDAWKSTMAKGGAAALAAHKLDQSKRHSTYEARYSYLAELPEKDLTAEQKREKEAIGQVLKIKSDVTATQLERTAAILSKEDEVAGRPQKNQSEYIRAAAAIVRDNASTNETILEEADRRGLKGDERFAFWKKQTEDLAAIRAAAASGATPLPANITLLRVTLEQGRRVMDKFNTTFTDDEIRKYAGWVNMKGRGLAQIALQDPKYAQFQSLVKQLKSIAFSDGGKTLTQYEGGITFGWVPTGDEISATDFIVKMKEARERIDSIDDALVRSATTAKSVIRDQNALPKPPPAGTKALKFQPGVVGPDGKMRIKVTED